MEKSLTPLSLHPFYQRLHHGIKQGDLEKCLERPLNIAALLRDSGDLQLVSRHHLLACRISEVYSLIYEGTGYSSCMYQ